MVLRAPVSRLKPLLQRRRRASLAAAERILGDALKPLPSQGLPGAADRARHPPPAAITSHRTVAACR